MAPKASFGNVPYRNARFPVNDLEQFIRAESALAPAHTGTRVELYSIERGVPLPDRFDDFLFRDVFAPAYHITESRFF
jgi:hypothetical protein